MKILCTFAITFLMLTSITLANQHKPTQFPTYFIGGLGGYIFSTGMGDMSEMIGDRKQWSRFDCKKIVKDISIKRHKTVNLIGHSMGAATAVCVANKLYDINVDVNFFGSVDAHRAKPIKSNVKYVENYFQFRPKRAEIKRAENNTETAIKIYDYRGVYSHIQIDNSPSVQKLIMNAIDYEYKHNIGRKSKEKEYVKVYNG